MDLGLSTKVSVPDVVRDDVEPPLRPSKNS